MVYTIKTSIDFEKQIKYAAHKIILVDFFASWCNPCRKMEPVICAMEKKYGDRVFVIKVDADKFASIADYYRVCSLPTFLFFKNGQKVGGFSGADEVKLKQKMAKLI